MTDDIAASEFGSILTESGSPTVIEKVKPLFRGRPTGRLRSIVRIWVTRHLDRQELLNLLDQDQRIAQDMGTTEHELRAWARKHFWRP